MLLAFKMRIWKTASNSPTPPSTITSSTNDVNVDNVVVDVDNSLTLRTNKGNENNNDDIIIDNIHCQKKKKSNPIKRKNY